MLLENLNKNFLMEVANIFKNNGYGNIAYDLIGYLFSDYFFDALVELYKNDPEKFMSTISVTSKAWL